MQTMRATKLKLPMYVKPVRGGFVTNVPGEPSEFFSVSKHGREEAISKAARRVERLADRSRANPDTGRFVRDPSRARGVFPVKVYRGEKVYRFWVAEWAPKPGRLKQARYSVGKWGEKGAEAMALERRRKEVESLLAD